MPGKVPADANERQLQDAGTNPIDECSLQVETFADVPTQVLLYHLSNKAYDRGVAAGVTFDQSEWPLPLAEYDAQSRVLKTFPTWLRSNESIYTKPRYKKVRSISFEDQEPIEIQKGFDLLFDLPTGFLKSPFEGFGVDPRIKYIVEAFEELPAVDEIVICIDDDTISIDGKAVRLPLHVYDEVRINIIRVHEAAREFANGEKREYLRSRILPSILPGYTGEAHYRTADDLHEIIQDAIHRRGTPRAKNTNRSAAVRTVMKSIDQIAADDPVQLFELSEKLELASLELLIETMSAEMLKKHKESYWQTFFRDNPFVLKVLFGLPVVMYTAQGSVGGMGLERTGEKYADFLIKAGALGNLAIAEIKTTDTPLLTRLPYRKPRLFGPSDELAGGVNQLLDQRVNLIALKKEADGRHEIQAWSVPCILIIGTSPPNLDLQRSFELFRGNQREVLVITFDELLAKLRAVHEFLIAKPDQADSI